LKLIRRFSVTTQAHTTGWQDNVRQEVAFLLTGGLADFLLQLQQVHQGDDDLSYNLQHHPAPNIQLDFSQARPL
jgi:hypothetical protein